MSDIAFETGALIQKLNSYSKLPQRFHEHKFVNNYVFADIMIEH